MVILWLIFVLIIIIFVTLILRNNKEIFMYGGDTSSAKVAAIGTVIPATLPKKEDSPKTSSQLTNSGNIPDDVLATLRILGPKAIYQFHSLYNTDKLAVTSAQLKDLKVNASLTVNNLITTPLSATKTSQMDVLFLNESDQFKIIPNQSTPNEYYLFDAIGKLTYNTSGQAGTNSQVSQVMIDPIKQNYTFGITGDGTTLNFDSITSKYYLNLENNMGIQIEGASGCDKPLNTDPALGFLNVVTNNPPQATKQPQILNSFNPLAGKTGTPNLDANANNIKHGLFGSYAHIYTP